MRFFTLIINFCLLVYLNCIDAPRNNRYDPKNPDKAELGGIIYEPDSLPVSGALLYLLDGNGNIVKLDTSDDLGGFLLPQIDPGVYTIVGGTKYFKDVIIEQESLWAGTRYPNYNIFFTTFHFEDDEINTIPYGFNKISGEWRVLIDTDGNKIYQGTDTDDNILGITFFRNKTKAFKFDIRFKISSVSGPQWETGILMWYQDNANYYSIIIKKTIIQYKFVRNGVETVLYTKNYETSEGVWHQLKSIFTGDGLVVYLDDVFLFPISLINIAFANGYWGMYVFNHDSGMITSVDFDDIYLEIP